MPVVIWHSGASLGGPRGVSPRCHPGAMRPLAPPSAARDRGEREAFDLLQVQFIVESNSAMGGRGSALGGGL